ncbi:MAG: DUF2913 family protein [Photobacterium frigidiphilum]|uniref:DUF2913 family protein n=1 Tax=Photobacterium frigidiphilum TaxID=264736 RepID=UPI003003A5D4
MNSTLLLDITTHALLHIEFCNLDKKLTITDRNVKLNQFLKRAIKSNRYKRIKKNIKQWLTVAKLNDGLESLLLSEQMKLIENCSTDMHRFVELISMIESQLSTKVQYANARELDLQARFGQVLVCVIEADLKAIFDEEGLMTKTAQILFIGSPEYKDTFSAQIDKSAHFQSVLAYEDETHLRIELCRL